MPWRQNKYDGIMTRSCSTAGADGNGRLVFGVMDTDDNVQLHPPVRLALQRVKQALLSCGYEVGVIPPPPLPADS